MKSESEFENYLRIESEKAYCTDKVKSETVKSESEEYVIGGRNEAWYNKAIKTRLSKIARGEGQKETHLKAIKEYKKRLNELN